MSELMGVLVSEAGKLALNLVKGDPGEEEVEEGLEPPEEEAEQEGVGLEDGSLQHVITDEETGVSWGRRRDGWGCSERDWIAWGRGGEGSLQEVKRHEHEEGLRKAGRRGQVGLDRHG